MVSKDESKEDEDSVAKDGETREAVKLEEAREETNDAKECPIRVESNAAPAVDSEKLNKGRDKEKIGDKTAPEIKGEGDANKLKEDIKSKTEGESITAKMKQEGDNPTGPVEAGLEVDSSAMYHQQMKYGYHPHMQHHPPPPYYGGYYPPPPHHPYYSSPMPPIDQEQSPVREGMHHFYPPPPFGYPLQHHYAPYPPASPVKSPGGSREYQPPHPGYFPSLTPPRFNHDLDGSGRETGGNVSKKDQTSKAPNVLGGVRSPPESSAHGSSEPTPNKASSLKVYVKPKGQNIPPEVVERRSRKNANSRARAAKHRARVAAIEQKSQSEWTEEDHKIIEVHYKRRNQKNDRSRERALEKKAEIDRILGKAENERSKLEMQFLENALGARARKNEGDRIRRRKLKELGVAHIGRNHKQYTNVGSPSKSGNYQTQQHPQQYSGYPPLPYGYGGYPPPQFGMIGPPQSPCRGYTSPLGGGDQLHPGYPSSLEGGDPYAPTNPPPPPALPILIPGESGAPPHTASGDTGTPLPPE